MINLNLLPPSAQQQLRQRLVRLLLQATAVRALFLTLIIVTIIVGTRWYLDLRATTLQNEIKALRSNQETQQTLADTIATVNQRVVFLKQAQAGVVGWSDRLAALTAALPGEITLQSLTIDTTTAVVTVSGHASTRTSLLTMKDNLEALDFIGPIELPLAALAQQQDIDFVISGMIEPST